jgi:hypothetical protein
MEGSQAVYAKTCGGVPELRWPKRTRRNRPRPQRLNITTTHISSLKTDHT